MAEINRYPKVFVSVGATFRPEQDSFVQDVFEHLRVAGLDPHTIGRTDFGYKNPLKDVESLMHECDGLLVIALERVHIYSGVERRDSQECTVLKSESVATVWNHIEAAMAYTLGLPILVLAEKGCRQEGLLEGGYDWYVQSVDVDPSSLRMKETSGRIASWRDAVLHHSE